MTRKAIVVIFFAVKYYFFLRNRYENRLESTDFEYDYIVVGFECVCIFFRNAL